MLNSPGSLTRTWSPRLVSTCGKSARATSRSRWVHRLGTEWRKDLERLRKLNCFFVSCCACCSSGISEDSRDSAACGSATVAEWTASSTWWTQRTRRSSTRRGTNSTTSWRSLSCQAYRYVVNSNCLGRSPAKTYYYFLQATEFPTFLPKEPRPRNMSEDAPPTRIHRWPVALWMCDSAAAVCKPTGYTLVSGMASCCSV